MPKTKRYLSLGVIITLLVCSVVALSLFVTDILISGKITDNAQKNLEEKTMDIARIVARSPVVIEGLSNQVSVDEIQTFTDEIRRITNVQYIVVFDMNKIRKSHPDPSKIGQPFVGGDEEAVLQGHEHISVAKGTLGLSLRSFTPVYQADGKQVGAVAVGILLTNVEQTLAQSRLIIYIGIGFGFLVGIGGALLLARQIKKIMFGLEPFEISKLLEERSAMLQSTREGIVAVDQNSRMTLVNAEALRLFHQAGIKSDPIGKAVEEMIPASRIMEVLQSGKAQLDQEQDLHGITLLTNSVPVFVNGEIVGAISTFRDKTEVKQLAEQLTGVRLYAEALRAHSHEFMNKLHVILGMIHMKSYDQLAAYINQIAHQQQTEIGFTVSHIKDPVLAGFLLGKLSYARGVGAELSLSEACYLPEPLNPEITHEIITVLGNLIDNALEAVEGCSSNHVDVILNYSDGQLTIEVKDTGHGISETMSKDIFTKGYSTKGEHRGMGLFLVQQSVEKLNGKIALFSEHEKGTTFRVVLPYSGKGESV